MHKSHNTCDIENCGGRHRGRGLCNKHLLRLQKYGSPHITKKAANGTLTGKECIIDGCNAPQKGRGMCSVHAGRARHHGDPLAPPKKLGNGQASEERKRENRKRALQNYYQTPHGKLRRRFATARRRILAGANSEHLSKEQFLALWNTPKCGLCGVEVQDADKSIDHIIPLSRGGGNEVGNLQIAHLRCNQRKNRFINSTGVK